jgi:tetratricopeptide (TPR) repeat protein
MKIFGAIILLTLTLMIMSCSDTQENDVKKHVVDQGLSEVPQGVQAISLFGIPLSMPEPHQDLLDNLADAKKDYDNDPTNVDYLIWYGRKLAYAGDYRGAIALFSKGIEMYPEESRLYRHRGHRYLTIREIDKAIADLEKGVILIKGQEDSIEEDGAPNPAGMPIYTRHSTIWYHLGLAYYFKHDWEKAHEAFQSGKNLQVNNDMEVSFSHWNYMTLRRMGRDAEAQMSVADIPDDIVVYESQPYLKLLSLYKGQVLIDEILNKDLNIEPSSAFDYGIANWLLYNGETDKAYKLIADIARPDNANDYGWGAFGFIAAEVDLKTENNKNK